MTLEKVPDYNRATLLAAALLLLLIEDRMKLSEREGTYLALGFSLGSFIAVFMVFTFVANRFDSKKGAAALFGTPALLLLPPPPPPPLLLLLARGLLLLVQSPAAAPAPPLTLAPADVPPPQLWRTAPRTMRSTTSGKPSTPTSSGSSPSAPSWAR